MRVVRRSCMRFQEMFYLLKYIISGNIVSGSNVILLKPCHKKLKLRFWA